MTFRSKQELSAAIPHIQKAPKDESFIENLCFRPERNQRSNHSAESIIINWCDYLCLI